MKLRVLQPRAEQPRGAHASGRAIAASNWSVPSPLAQQSQGFIAMTHLSYASTVSPHCLRSLESGWSVASRLAFSAACR